MAIKDSGARTTFNSGAVRDINKGDGRCDLLPLGVVSSLLGGKVILDNIDEYIENGDIDMLYYAVKAFQFDLDIITTILEVSIHYEEGAVKYGERNWEKGIPSTSYISSGVRHYLKHLRGDKDERHDRAFVWNMFGAIWNHKNRYDLVDLPFNTTIYEQFKKEREQSNSEDKE